jgi:ubiquinone/menaquinone biosynthesis C-methylase UbiE
MPPDAPVSGVGSRLTTDQIRAYWAEQAAQFGQSPSASWSDHWMIQLEISAISRWLEEGDHVLDVGCGNGFATVAFAERCGIRIVGVDAVPEMVDQANRRLEVLAPDLRDRIVFAAGDVTSLEHIASSSIDKVISTRVIINLATDDEQAQGLLECARVLRPGGLFLLSEATLQGWRRLNALRAEWGLDEIPMPQFNRYLDVDLVTETLAPTLELTELVDFASSYYVGTRFLKPLLVATTGCAVDVANPDTEFNRFCASLPAVGDYGTQKLFVFRKP